MTASTEIEALFRRESGRLVSVLTRIFGPRNLRLADDLAVYLEGEWTTTTAVNAAFDESLIKDDQLRMIFMCCAWRTPASSNG